MRGGRITADSSRASGGKGGFSLRARLRSIRSALYGLRLALRSQHNAWIHVSVAAAVVIAGLAAQLSAADWRWIIAAVAMVWAAETMNTAFEFLCDVVSPQYHESVRKAKDIAAGAALVTAFAAAIVGCLTLWRYLP